MTIAPQEIVQAPAREWRSYPEYKDAGVEWLDDIPEHWAVRPLFVALREREEKNVGLRVENVLSLSYGKIVPRNVESNFGLLPASFETYQIVRPGNIILRLTDLQNDKRSIRVGLVEQHGIITSAYLCLESGPSLLPRFVHYLLLSFDLTKVFYNIGGGVRQSIKFETLRHLPILTPPLTEQRNVVAFLDRETQKIDNLIMKRERLIELLEERKTALISRAVTQGLDPEVPMKDSGVDWLGQIPGHWNAVRIRNVAESMQTGPFGSQLHSYDYVTGGIPVINPSHLREGRLDPDPTCAVDEQTQSRLRRHQLRGGDLIFARRGELGRCALVTNQEQGWLCGTGSLRVRLLKHLADPAFLNLALSTRGVKDWLVLESVGATMDNLNTGILARVPLPLPPLLEQREIVDFINQEIDRIDALAGKVREHIEKLREYRRTLISAAVTGKIDVRGEVP